MTPLEYDRTHIWHPYASLGNPPPVRLAKSASGVEIELADGTRLVDAVSSWWCVAHGYSHPAIVEAVRRQSERLSHVMFGGFTHEPAIELAEKLADFAPPGLDRVFFADSGSISVEVAAKMAVQYQAALGRPGRNRLVALKGGYHGDTSLCMALSDPDGMHTLFKGLMSPHFFAEKPTVAIDAAWDAEDVSSLRKIIEEHADEIAALICEPCFQAANAMNFYHPAYLKAMREICDEYGLLLIFDEIAAGCYRTGPRWAHARAGIVPDVMTVGKALTGGHHPGCDADDCSGCGRHLERPAGSFYARADLYGESAGLRGRVRFAGPLRRGWIRGVGPAPRASFRRWIGAIARASERV